MRKNKKGSLFYETPCISVWLRNKLTDAW